MWTWLFWMKTADRAIRTLAQTMLATWLVGDKIFNMFDVDFVQTLGVGLGAAAISVLTSIATSTPWAPGNEGDPSILK